MYIPPLYRTIFRIVAEKESKVKESMRMMGMTDFSYWMSWFTYYSLVNLLVSTLSWLVLNFAVFKNSNGFLVWVLLWMFG
jgi:ATP-binding cassette subfamily A (ABC1) protein 3